jgi:hypothetical protein
MHVLIPFVMGDRPPYGANGGVWYQGEPNGVLPSDDDVYVRETGTALIECLNGNIHGEQDILRRGGDGVAYFYQSRLLTCMLDRMRGVEEPGNYRGDPFYFVFYNLNNCVKGYKILYFVMDRIESLPPERRNGVLAALHMTIRDISFRLDSIVCGNYVRRVGAEDAEPDAHNGDAGPLMPSPDDIESCFNSVNDILDACAGKLG